jgi:hypothetical protein
MADNTEFCRRIVQDWNNAFDAIRKAGGTSITVPVADMAIILNAALSAEGETEGVATT